MPRCSGASAARPEAVALGYPPRRSSSACARALARRRAERLAAEAARSLALPTAAAALQGSGTSIAGGLLAYAPPHGGKRPAQLALSALPKEPVAPEGSARRGVGHNSRVPVEPFAVLAARGEPPLDELALALAGEFRDCGAGAALAELDRLGGELALAGWGDPAAEADALRELLGERHAFAGDQEDYDHPHNSMLDLVLERRRGLPILLSIVYVEVARRAGIALEGVGLPGHYVVGHFGQAPPLLLDPFRGGAPLAVAPAPELRPWRAHETALRMLNNLVGSYMRRADLTRAIRAAEMRLELPLREREAGALGAELRSLRARLN